jgi:hypothetical protein
MKLMLYPLPTPTMKKDAMGRTSGADESIPEKRMRSPLFPNFHIGIVIHEIRKQQRSEERYVRGASH